MTVFVTALLSLLLCGVFLKLGNRLGWGKSIRQDGPESHHTKAGTTTMGGAAFLLAAGIAWLKRNPCASRQPWVSRYRSWVRFSTPSAVSSSFRPRAIATIASITVTPS